MKFRNRKSGSGRTVSVSSFPLANEQVAGSPVRTGDTATGPREVDADIPTLRGTTRNHGGQRCTETHSSSSAGNEFPRENHCLFDTANDDGV